MFVPFNRAAFLESFEVSLDAIAQAETVTKRELMGLSRTILEFVHETGDIGPVNRLLAVLTPVNKKVAKLFFVHFTGFHFDDVAMLFVKKSKKRYADALVAYREFIADPHNNIWTWAQRHVEVEAKPFTADKVKNYMVKALKDAQAAGMSELDVFRGVFGAGFKVETIIALLAELDVEPELVMEGMGVEVVDAK